LAFQLCSVASEVPARAGQVDRHGGRIMLPHAAMICSSVKTFPLYRPRLFHGAGGVVRVKFSKSRVTSFLPVGNDIEQIVADRTLEVDHIDFESV
jgi:hypothetical protein